MPLKMMMTADVSTTHLSVTTRELMDSGKFIPYEVAVRDSGWLIATYEAPDTRKVPEDLRLVLEFARQGKADYVLFDADGEVLEELPQYGDSNAIEVKGSLLEAGHIQTSRVSLFDYDDDPSEWIEVAKDFDELKALITPSAPVLPDGDYIMPEGGWVEIGGLAVRLAEAGPENDREIQISAFVNGHCDNDRASVLEFAVEKIGISDLKEQLERQEDFQP